MLIIMKRILSLGLHRIAKKTTEEVLKIFHQYNTALSIKTWTRPDTNML